MGYSTEGPMEMVENSAGVGWFGAVQGDCQPYSSKTEDSLDNSYLAWFLGVHGPLVKD